MSLHDLIIAGTTRTVQLATQTGLQYRMSPVGAWLDIAYGVLVQDQIADLIYYPDEQAESIRATATLITDKDGPALAVNAQVKDALGQIWAVTGHEQQTSHRHSRLRRTDHPGHSYGPARGGRP